MPIIDLQKRARELGRIRLGQKGDRGQPQKLDRFRFTSHSESLIRKIAELYGGEARQWTPEGRAAQWEVISNSTRVPIMVPPGPVTQWHEVWRKSGCVHRCDGQRNVLTDELCDPEDPIHREALDKPTTRLNVVLRDVEGIGVWRTETKGWNAAIELPDVAEFLAHAGGYVEGWLSLEQRTSIDNSGDKPRTYHYVVPIIEVDVTPARLMAGGGRVAAPTIEGPVQRPQLEAPKTDAGDTADEVLAGYYARLQAATTSGECMEVYQDAVKSGHCGHGENDLYRAIGDRGRELGGKTETAGEEPHDVQVDDAAPPVDVAEPDPDVVWQQVLAEAGRLGMTTSQVTDDFAANSGGVSAATASGGELAHYLDLLKGREAA